MKNNKYIKFIDGLRAIAVISVIVYHLDPSWLPGGFSGVDVFFVISGFVVSMSIFNSERSVSGFLSNFYRKRVLRILPALLFMITGTSLLTVLFTINGYLTKGIASTARSAVLGISNYYLSKKSFDYFGAVTEFNPFIHTWSLGVEEQFYLLFPLIFFFLRKKISSSKFIALIFFSISVMSLALSRSHGLDGNQMHAFYSLSTRFWQLLCGVIVFLLSKDLNFKKNFSVLVSLLLTSLFVSLFLLNPSKFPYPHGIISVIITCLLILTLLVSKSNIITYLLESSVSSYLGKRSYSLYLWHWPIIVLFRWTCGLDSFLKYLICLIVIFLFSIFSFEFIEKRFRHYPRLLRLSSKRFFCGTFFLLVINFVFVDFVFKKQNQISLSLVNDSREMWFDHGSFNEESKRVDICKKITRNITNSDGLEILKYKGDQCFKKPYSFKVFTLGDSHAASYESMFMTTAKEMNIDQIIFSGPGCSPFPLSSSMEKYSEDCKIKIRKFLQFIVRESSEGDYLFLPALRLSRFVDAWILFAKEKEAPIEEISNKTEQIVLDEFHSLISDITKKGINIIIEAPKPIFYIPTYRCQDWFNKHNPICQLGASISSEYLRSYRKPVFDIMKKIKGVKVLDPFDNLCSKENCHPIDSKGRPIFSDGDHLSPFGNRLVYESFLLSLGL